ncbi:MAG: sigma-54 dependent transcriptional regulator [Desulfobacterales bacterium]|nr:sigma-54 dependent transcriptional regulator [Desulfobacterales bacterium]
MTDVLIIDDDPKICLVLTGLMEEMGHAHEAAQTIAKGKAVFQSRAWDLVLLDLELPDGNGLDLLPELLDVPEPPEVIIITGTGDARGAELAFKYGAWDYVQKPFLLNEVTLPITRALEYRKEKQASARPVSLIRPHILGDCPSLRKCLEEVAKAATTDVSVLITGETGTGKELFARAIHENSRRSGHPFIAVDCGALPETLVESTLFGHEKGAFTGAGQRQEGLIVQANNGTLMLDEVGDLPLPAQKSLLRTLQERIVRPIGGAREVPVNIRLVAATHLDLDEMVAGNRFRKDFLYRIRAMEIKLPPLRDRGSDIEEIAIHKIHELCNRYQMEHKAVSSDFLDILAVHPWPGNVRELVNLLEYVLASAGADPTIFPKHLPADFRMARLDFDAQVLPAGQAAATTLFPDGDLPPLADFRNRAEKNYLKELLNRAAGDRKEACRISGISQSRLYGLLSKHNLSGFSAS